MTQLQDPRFNHSPTFEGFDVADWRESHWTFDEDLYTAEEVFHWPSEEAIEEAWEDNELLPIDVARALNPSIDICFHENGAGTCGLLTTDDGILFFVYRESETDEGPWVLLDPDKRIEQGQYEVSDE